MIEISHWLKHRGTYEDGLKLLSHYNPEHPLLNILSRKETLFNRSKLIELLRSIPSGFSRQIASNASSIIHDEDYFRADDSVKSIIEEAKMKFKEASRLHSSLVLLVASAKTKAAPLIKNQAQYINAINSFLLQNKSDIIAHDLLDLDDEIASLFYRIDYWKLHHKLPETAASIPEVPMSRSDMERSLRNLLTKRSKLKKKNPSDTQLSAIQRDIDLLKQHIDALV